MKKIQTLLQGKKSYIIAAVGAIIYFCKSSGVVEITPDTEHMIYRMLEILFGVSIAAKINRVGKP